MKQPPSSAHAPILKLQYVRRIFEDRHQDLLRNTRSTVKLDSMRHMIRYKETTICSISNRLRLARAGDGAVRAAVGHRRAIGSRGVAVGLGAGGGGDLEVPHVDQGLLASVAARTANFGGLVVCGNVEGDEEEQVRGDDGNTGESGELLTSALAHVGSPWEVDRGEVRVGGEVDEACGALVSVVENMGPRNIPRSMTNCTICSIVMYCFHQMRTPRALWK